MREQRLNSAGRIAIWVSYVGLPPVVDCAGQIRGAGDRRASHLAEITVNLVHTKARGTTSLHVIETLRDGVTA